MNKTIIPLYCFDWHLNQSPAQEEIIVKPLSPYMEFNATPWDTVNLNLSKETIRNTPLVFFMFPPPPSLLSDPGARLVWVPMWDMAKKYRDTWWNELPKSLRVVAFSEEIRRRTVAAGLPTLIIKHYKDPDEIRPADWQGPRVLFYWNRTGLVGKEFLHKICSALNVDTLYFRRRIDPGWPSWCDYELPERLGKTKVQKLHLIGAEGYQQYLEHFNQSNIFIGPRQSEGVGLSFLEAMTKGCAVFAYDAPTMNEYIEHKKSGYLFLPDHLSEFLSHREKLVQQVYRRLTRSDVLHPQFRHPVTVRQDWKQIAQLDLQALGEKSRQDQLDGFRAYQNAIDRFASFIADW